MKKVWLSQQLKVELLDFIQTDT